MSTTAPDPTVSAHIPTPRRRRSHRAAWGLILAAVAAALVAGIVARLTSSGLSLEIERFGAVLPAAEFEAATGVRITRVGLSGADGIVDVRYQVLDPDKAVVVHDKENPPALVQESDGGEVFGRSWHSHTRRQQLRAGGTYYFLLLNERGGLDHGSTVYVKIGRMLLPNVIVQ